MRPPKIVCLLIHLYAMCGFYIVSILLFSFNFSYRFALNCHILLARITRNGFFRLSAKVITRSQHCFPGSCHSWLVMLFLPPPRVIPAPADHHYLGLGGCLLAEIRHYPLVSLRPFSLCVHPPPFPQCPSPSLAYPSSATQPPPNSTKSCSGGFFRGY